MKFLVLIITLFCLFSCEQKSLTEESLQHSSDTTAVSMVGDTTNMNIYNFINELLKDTIISLGKRISVSPINFPNESDKEEINRMVVENKSATKEKYYLSGVLYYCIKNDDLEFMLKSKHNLTNFKWDLKRINFNMKNDSNWYELSPPLFNRNRTKAIMQILYVCPDAMCCSGCKEMLYEKLNGKWIERDNFDFVN